MFEQITIDGKTYDLFPTKETKQEQLICILDGYKYFLGPQSDVTMRWEDALVWCKSLGATYELPSREVLLMCYINAHIRRNFASVVYWSSTESNASDAWYQGFDVGYQDYYGKDIATYVRAVRRLPI